MSIDMGKKIAVIGAGSWGTTLASIIGWNGFKVNLWSRGKELADEINQKNVNTQYLPAIRLPDSITASSSLKEAVEGADIIIIVVPSEFIKSVSKTLSDFVRKDAIFVNAAKGFAEDCMLISDIIKQEIGSDNIVALSGPNIAEEVIRKVPTATVIASESQNCLSSLKGVLESPYFKIYPIEDMAGIQVCGALKNITAIATGVCDGLGLGDNARGSIITLGLMEMNNFGRNFGAKQSTCYGLAGVGDLVATCTSRKSRNRFVGEMIAKGKPMEEIKKEMNGMVAEGIRTTKAVYEFSRKHGIDMPLTTQVYKVLYEEKKIKNAVSDLIKLI